MQSFQSVIVGGHLGRDPEVRYTAKGTQLMFFSVAVGWRRPVRGQTGEWEDMTSWYNVSMGGPRVDYLSTHLKTGMAVVVEGELQPDMYHSDKDNTMRLDLRMRAYNVIIADRADRTDRDGDDEPQERPRSQPRREPAASGASGNNSRPARREEPADDLEDLPF